MPFILLARILVKNGILRSHTSGANGGPGDQEVVRAAALRQPRRNQIALFVDDAEYPKWIESGGGPQETLANIARMCGGLALPSHIAVPLIHRQSSTFIFYNHLIEELLDLGSQSRAKDTQKNKKTPQKETTIAMANLSVQPRPLKVAISDVIAQAVEHRTAAEDYLQLLRSEPILMDAAIRMSYISRPELVPDDRGRILPLITDRYISSAFFEVMSDAVKVVDTWAYIVRLVSMLDGLNDKVKRPLLTQELSNTCHHEYRRAQAAFRRQMAVRPGFAGPRFRRIGGKIAMKGSPGEATISDPQLHYVLRLCHPDTSHKDAVEWIQKLDDHNAQYANDRSRLNGHQVLALGDLAIIISFMHTLSTALSMPTGSKKSGMLFIGRSAEMDAELAMIKEQADFGDFLIPMHNVLEPGVAASALQALDAFVLEKAGESLGSLYDRMLQECLEDVEEKYMKTKARYDEKTKENGKKLGPPTHAQHSPSTAFKIEQRREKAKTRPLQVPIHDITAIDTEETPAGTGSAPRLQVKASVAAVFESLFAKSEARGSVAWADFATAMGDIGFSVTPKGGSVFQFNPPTDKMPVDSHSITLHRPHTSQIEGWQVTYFAKRLQRKYGWEKETFEVV
jgi:hypothetical protein